MASDTLLGSLTSVSMNRPSSRRAVSVPAPALRSRITIRAPACDRVSAAAAPRPEAPPDMTATMSCVMFMRSVLFWPLAGVCDHYAARRADDNPAPHGDCRAKPVATGFDTRFLNRVSSAFEG